MICIGAGIVGDNVGSHTFIDNIFSTTGSGGQIVNITSAGLLYTASSSRKFKKDIEDMGNISQDLYSLRPVTFHYKEEFANGDKSLQYGLIAEEVEKINRDLVVYDKNGVIYSVQYQRLTPLMLNELQKEHKLNMEQQNMIEELNGQNAKLRIENASVKSSLDDVQAKLQSLAAKVDALANKSMSAK